MNSVFRYLLCALWLSASCMAQEEKSFKVLTIAFYNLENLFDFEDDPITFDDDRTPEGKDHWTEEIYRAKIANMAKVISEIGYDRTSTTPGLVGVCEIENKRVLEDLVNHPSLRKEDYGIIHFDSPDRRGIDVGFLYKKSIFRPSHYQKYELVLHEEEDPLQRIYTRDQLVISGYLEDEKIHCIVNHWPSRRGGEAKSEYKRVKAAQLNRKIIDSLFSVDPYAKIITMGDLNDDPNSKSVKKYLKAKEDRSALDSKEMFNPMSSLFQKGIGSLAYADRWNLFDQIIVSTELVLTDYSSYRMYKAGIYNKPYLSNSKGKYKGYPYRSFINGGFTGGYSDHFPVYLLLIKEMSD